MPEELDLIDTLVDRIAEGVVRKIDERQKIDLIAEAVLARLEEQSQGENQEKASERAVQEGTESPLEAAKVAPRRGSQAASRLSKSSGREERKPSCQR